MWELVISDRAKILPVIFKLADELEPRHGITLRHMTRRSLRRDMDRFAEVYNSAWSENWDFTPYTKKTLGFLAGELQLVFDADWMMVAETPDGDTAAVAITTPDINQVLRQDERPAAAVRLVALPAPPQDHGPRPRGLPRRQAGLPAHGRGGRRCTSSTSTRRPRRRSSGARWAGSSRPTAT